MTSTGKQIETKPNEELPSKLTCQSVLRVPSKTIGENDDRIVYSVSQPAWQCSFSKDAKWLSVCYGAPDPCIRIYKFEEDEWRLDATLEGIHDRTVRSVAFAPILSPTILASASFDGTVAIWEHTNQAPDNWECLAQLEGHDNEVKCVRWNATGSLLATGGRDKTVWIWESFLAGAVGGPSPSHQDDVGDFECLAGE
jgi:WD40 repeat protein